MLSFNWLDYNRMRLCWNSNYVFVFFAFKILFSSWFFAKWNLSYPFKGTVHHFSQIGLFSIIAPWDDTLPMNHQHRSSVQCCPPTSSNELPGAPLYKWWFYTCCKSLCQKEVDSLLSTFSFLCVFRLLCRKFWHLVDRKKKKKKSSPSYASLVKCWTFPFTIYYFLFLCLILPSCQQECVKATPW